MACGAVGILAEAQHSALSLIAGALEKDFLGLSVAARAARKVGMLSARDMRRLVRLDEAAHFARHATTPRMDAFLAGVRVDIEHYAATRDVCGGEMDPNLEDLFEHFTIVKEMQVFSWQPKQHLGEDPNLDDLFEPVAAAVGTQEQKAFAWRPKATLEQRELRGNAERLGNFFGKELPVVPPWPLGSAGGQTSNKKLVKCKGKIAQHDQRLEELRAALAAAELAKRATQAENVDLLGQLAQQQAERAKYPANTGTSEGGTVVIGDIVHARHCFTADDGRKLMRVPSGTLGKVHALDDPAFRVVFPALSRTPLNLSGDVYEHLGPGPPS